MEIKANKNQSLDYHLMKISEEIFSLKNFGLGYFENNKENKEILIYANLLVGLLHDIGKTSYYFQERLRKNLEGKGKKEVDIKEYHNWGYFFYKDILNKFFKYKNININNTILESISYTGAISILNHHFDLDNNSKIDNKLNLQEGEANYIKFNGILKGDIKVKDYIKILFNENVINNLSIKSTFKEIFKKTKNKYIKDLSLFLIDNYKFSINIFNDFGEKKTKINGFSIAKNFGLSNKNNNTNNEITTNFLFNINNIRQDLAFRLLNFVFLPNLIFIDKKVSIELKDEDFVKYNKEDNNLIYNYYTQSFPLEKSKGLNFLRGTFFKEIHEKLKENREKKIHIIEAPAGIGKFLSLTSYATKLLDNNLKKVVYIAPFVSILDQNSEVLKTNILKKEDNINDKNFSKINYLSKKRYILSKQFNNIDNLGNEKFTYLEKYMLKSLNSKYVFTTFVNIFNSLFSFKNIDYIQTLNILNNSILIIDEIQDFNKENLFFLKYFLKNIVPNHNIKIILSSATLPLYIYENLDTNSYFYYNYYKENKKLESENRKFFNRHSLTFLTDKNISEIRNIEKISYDIEDEILYTNIINNIKENKRILFINNTIKSSEKLGKNILDKLGVMGEEGKILEGKFGKKYIYYFLNNKSKNKFERDILIEKIKNHNDDITLLLFSTQLIKAGVDIDMDICFSDFFNLYDIIQIMGRINRNNKRNYDNKLFLYVLKNGKKYDYEKIAGKDDKDNNNTKLFLKYIKENGIKNNIDEQYLYNKELVNFNKFLVKNIKVGDYTKLVDMLDYDSIREEAKLIKDRNEEITYIKDLSKFLFINEEERNKLENYFNKIIENKYKIIEHIKNEEIELKGKKYNLESFLNTIKLYELENENYNLGEYINLKNRKIYKEFNEFII